MNGTPNKDHPALKGIKPTVIGISVNLLLVLVKGVAGILGNSFALVADAIESISDVISSVVLWAGLRIATKAPDDDHPYGHGKAEPLAASIIALSLIAAAILISVESIHNIRTPHQTPASFTLWVLVIVVITKEVLFRYVLKVGNEIESTAVTADAWHHRSDMFTSLAAFIGISVALIGGEGYEIADDFAALFAAGIILFNAYRILRPAMNEIMDAAPATPISEQVRAVASIVEGVVGLEKCFVRKMGFEFYVDLHVLVDGQLTVRECHEIAHQVKASPMQANPRIYDVLVHIEPEDAH
ncbi:cation diffusion facilitator family transporter [soil metagenome]